jgi:lipid-A-disaccharide synthase-like uncharacterized protein
MQHQFASCAGNVIFDQRFLVSWQSIDYQSDWFFALLHHLLEQPDK